VDRTDEHVVANLIQMPTIAQPGSSRRNVVGCALALGLDQHRQVYIVAAIPRLERFQELQSFAIRLDQNLNATGICLGSEVTGGVTNKAFVRKLLAAGRFQPELSAVWSFDGVLERVEFQGAGQRVGGHNFGTAYEGQSLGIAVVTASEVAVEGGDDRIGLVRRDVFPLSLPDTRAARIG